MMQLVTNRRGISKRLTQTMLLCIFTVAFAMSSYAKSYFDPHEEICQHSTSENFTELETAKIFTSNTMNSTAMSAVVSPCNVGPGVIGGVAFLDYSFNGVQAALEPFQAGIEVYLYTNDATGNSISAAASTVTDANGEYAFNGLTAGQMYRVEFVIPESLNFLGFTQVGDDNGTNVQFTTPGTCDISVGVGAESEYYQANPLMVTPCYINGAGAAGTEEGDAVALLGVEYDAEGMDQNINLFSASEVGSLWGVAYNRDAETVFSSAALRRHMGFGPGGTGAIYFMDITDIDEPNIEAILDLNELGLNTGADPRLTDTGSLPSVFGVPNHDTNAWNEVAKMSLGGIEISNDGKTLYAVNLFTKELVTIDLTDYVLNGVVPGAGQVSAVAIPSFNCDASSDWRPWALKFHKGNIYIGGVCSAESTQDANDLNATVVKFDGADFTEEYSFPLTFQRGDPFNSDNDPQNQRNLWYPWSNDIEVMLTGQYNDRLIYPQPILSDIEFDIDGSLILGFLDRTSQQGGYRNYRPNPDNVELITTFSGGDITRVCNIGGTYALEGSDPACTNPTGLLSPQGPNGQEYYWEDRYSFGENPMGTAIVHSEIALGGLAMILGTGDVLSTVFDPLLTVDAGGLAWFNNVNGDRVRAYEIFTAQDGLGFPGKSNGLGGLGLVGSQAPDEIGNYVWLDCNGDGIQNASEDPLPGVNVALFDAAGNLLATEVSDANGEYYFSEPDVTIDTNSDYYIVFGTMGQYTASTNNTTVGGDDYQLTIANAGQLPNSDNNDSDPQILGTDAPASIQGLQGVKYTTGCVGEVNHTIDAGFSSGVVMVNVVATPGSCGAATDGSIEITATPIEATTTLEYNINGGTFQSSNVFSNLSPGTYTVMAQPLPGAGGCGGTAMAVVTVGANPIPDAPTTEAFDICINEAIPAGMGLTATCAACVDGAAAILSWYDAATGGNLVATTAVFDPIAAGEVAGSVAGEYTFYAQCTCGPCESDRTAATLTIVDNPMPTIVGDASVCPGSQATFTVDPLNPMHTFEWEILTPGITFVGGNTGAEVIIQIPDLQGAGPYTLQVTETGSIPACMGTTTIDLTTKETTLVCNNDIQVSLDANGCALITPDVILEGITGTGIGCYDVMITNQFGENFGDKLTCENIGDVLTVNVASVCEENSCWGSIIVEDKLAPVIDCPTAPIVVDCLYDINQIAAPVATDNCGTASVVLNEETINDSDVCGGVTIDRTYVAIDAMGNISDVPCEQNILIEQADQPLFPLDIIWQCNQYAAYPNITDATPLAAVVPDNDLTTPNTIEVPFWLSSNTLANSGAGTIDITEGLYCNYAVSHTDDTLAACTGLKIIRTWALLNWCTNQVVLVDNNGNDNVQLVKVIDTQSPVITGESFTMTANNPADHPASCTTTGMIPLPDLDDNCGAAFMHIFTEIGEAVYVNGVDATEGAYVPEPGLPIGFHMITFVAGDDCANVTETSIQVEVVDDVDPTAVCEEITDVVLNSEGLATVQALAFDDGSNDNCCIDSYEVKRLSEGNNAYSSEILFDCSEAGETVLVMLNVTDCYNNSSSCTIEVNIEDKEVPTCSLPNDVTMTCLEYSENDIDATSSEDLEEQFGAVTMSDNCGTNIEELPTIISFEACGNGFIKRRFLPIDLHANIGMPCEQNIFITYEPDYKLVFPADYEGSCGDLIEEPEAILQSAECDLIAVSHTDQLFNLSDDGACYEIIRHYQVVNWCTYVAGDPALEFNDNFSSMSGEMVDEATFGNASHLVYSQNIRIIDNIAPVLSYTGETEFCVDDNCVTGSASLPIEIDENCTSELNISWVLDAFNDNADGEFDNLGNGQFNGAAPLGTHRISYIVEDGCGNVSFFDITFEIKDCKAPIAYCNGGIVIDLMDTNPPMVQIWANDLDAGSFDTCGGEVTPAFSTNPLDTGMVFTCLELGSNQVEVYFIDESGNYDYCLTEVIIQENLLVTNGTPCVAPDDPVIAGTIMTETGQGLQGAMVELNGNNNIAVTTNEAGTFAFNEVEADYDYSINSMYDVDHDNGVTTFDLSLIRSHILSINLLDSPYKIIAADANNSQSITTSDIVALRRLILTMDNELSNNTSWRFVDASYEFPNPQDPWEAGFPEVLNFNNLTASQLNADFTAIKIGDVNGNAQANLTGDADERSTGEVLQFDVKNTAFKAGENVTIDLTANDYKNISSYQFTFDFDTDALEFVGLKTTEFSTAADFGMTHKEAGYITVAHYNEAVVELEDNTIVFSLEFKAKQAGTPSDFIKISSAKTAAIAYGATAETMHVELAFSSTDETFALYQNRPNPFAGATEIPFFLPTAGKVKLSVYDVSGKLMKLVEGEYNAGYHQIAVNREELGAGSIFYYQLDTENHSATRKMVLIK